SPAELDWIDLGDRRAPVEDGAGIGADHPVEQPQQRRLAAAAASHDAGHLALGDLEMRDLEDPAEPYVVEGELRRHRCGHDAMLLADGPHESASWAGESRRRLLAMVCDCANGDLPDRWCMTVRSRPHGSGWLRTRMRPMSTSGPTVRS